MRNDISNELLKKYVDGNCTEDEALRVKAWYASFDEDDDHVSGLIPEQQTLLENQVLDKILNNIHQINPEVFEQQAVVKQLWFKSGYFKIAAAAAAVLIVGGLFFATNRTPSVPALSNISEQLSVINKTKFIYKQLLPDGSTAWLSPGSKLQYPRKFNGASRMVAMKGECFFEVTKNPKRPFIISSGSIITKVWGTSFRVRDFDANHKADVSVVTGKVSVSVDLHDQKTIKPELGAQEVMLHPKQKVSLVYQENKLLTGTTANDESLKIWQKTKLSFDNASLKNIIATLDKKFDVDITVDNEKLNNNVLSADLADFNLPEILEIFKKSLGVNYEIAGNNIYLTKPIIKN